MEQRLSNECISNKLTESQINFFNSCTENYQMPIQNSSSFNYMSNTTPNYTIEGLANISSPKEAFYYGMINSRVPPLQIIGAGIYLIEGVFNWISYTEKQKAQKTKKTQLAEKKIQEMKQKHLPWDLLNSYRGKTKKGISSKGKQYFYEKDWTHTDTEVYKKQGSIGVHVGSCPRIGGEISKPAVYGRTINL